MRKAAAAKVSEAYWGSRRKEKCKSAFIVKCIFSKKTLLVIKPEIKLIKWKHGECAARKALPMKEGTAGRHNRIFITAIFRLIDCCKTIDGVFERGHSNVTNYGVKCYKQLVFIRFTPTACPLCIFCFVVGYILWRKHMKFFFKKFAEGFRIIESHFVCNFGNGHSTFFHQLGSPF